MTQIGKDSWGHNLKTGLEMRHLQLCLIRTEEHF